MIDPLTCNSYVILQFCEDTLMSDNGREGKFKSFSLWNAFSSVKLTLFLLILLAVASILGTVIPQQEGTTELAEKLSPGLVNRFVFPAAFRHVPFSLVQVDYRRFGGEPHRLFPGSFSILSQAFPRCPETGQGKTIRKPLSGAEISGEDSDRARGGGRR
jgi:hypothetical protein